MARVPLLETADLSEEYRYLFEENELGVLNLFRALGNNPPLLQSYMRWGTALWREAGIDTRRVELVILAVASELESAYEWHQHAEAGLEAGLTEAELGALRRGDVDALDPDDRAIAEYAVACVRGSVDDATHEALRDRFDARTVVGIALLATHYLLTARVVDALSLDHEGEFVGWDLEGR